MTISVFASRFSQRFYTSSPVEVISLVIKSINNNPPTGYIPGTGALSLSLEKDRTFFLVNKLRQKELNFSQVRNAILTYLQLPIDCLLYTSPSPRD